MTSLNQVIGSPGVHQLLRHLEREFGEPLPTHVLADILSQHGASTPDETLQAMLQSNLLHPGTDGISITEFGIRTALLMDAMHGADLREIWRRLSQLDPSLRNYELIRNHLTAAFLDSLIHRPGFGRLYICSPWISLDAQQQRKLTHGLSLTQNLREPEILVITRPFDTANSTASIELLKRLGASIYLNRSLHTKLYIREPDASGGYFMAILGSQNLTRSSYLELGIKIHSDSLILQNLIKYFFDLMADCDEAP